MNTIDFKTGIYKNYRILCKALEEPIFIGGGSVKSQLKRWEKYIEFKKSKINNSYNVSKILIYTNEILAIKMKNQNNYSKKEYINFKYEQKELDIINSSELFEEDIKIINELKEKYKNKKYEPIIQDLYTLYVKAQYSPSDLGVVYHKDGRTFQTFFKNNGLSRNLFEAQQIAKNKRDYKEIMNKGRETMINNQILLKGSKPEIYTRDYINCRLSLEIPNLEIIVGVNNKSILDNGKEIDIPIIIIDNNKIYKFAIEYNGNHWHENKNKDNIKLVMINQKGYHLFFIAPKQNATNKQVKEYIENEIDTSIIPYIKNFINGGNKLNE